MTGRRRMVRITVDCFEITDSYDGSLAGMVTIRGPNLDASGMVRIKWLSEPKAGGRVKLTFPDIEDSIECEVLEFDDTPGKVGAKAYPQQVRRMWKGQAEIRAMPEARIHG
jgi:hypothetical protein